MNREIIRIEHLKKSYGDITPIEDISTSIYKGDVVSIIGPSGTGKSTFIRCVNLLETPTAGKIFIDGDEITAPDADIVSIRKKMGMVFQSFNLFPHMSVIENVMTAPIDQLGLSRQDAYDHAMELLRTVRIEDKAYAYPSSLSGGQKQRVAIARSLAMNPEILLLDEPTSALDPERVEEVRAVVYDLAKKGMTMLIVTHEMSFARNASNRIFYMDEGGIYEEGTPDEIFDNPKKEKTRRFIKQNQRCAFDIQSAKFDYYELLGLLELFCRNNRISKRLHNRLSVVTEELIVNIILAKLPANSEFATGIHVELDTPDPQHITMSLVCPDNVDLTLTEDDSLTLTLIQGMTQDITQNIEDGMQYATLELGE